MADKRKKGSTQYSKHPPTQKVRARIAAMAPEERAVFLARSQEYQAIRACCIRACKRESYLNASITERRMILIANARSLLQKRRNAGKLDGKANLSNIVTRHLQKEARERTTTREGNVVPPPTQGLAMAQRETVPLFTTKPTTPTGDAFLKFDDDQDESDPGLAAVAAYPDYAAVRDVVDALRREVGILRDEVGALRGEVNILRRGDAREDETFW